MFLKEVESAALNCVPNYLINLLHANYEKILNTYYCNITHWKTVLLTACSVELELAREGLKKDDFNFDLQPLYCIIRRTMQMLCMQECNRGHAQG